MEHKFKNIEQSEYWNEKSGPKWVKLDDSLNERFSIITDELFNRASIKEGDCILDIGCGGGQTSYKAKTLVGSSGYVMGADISETLLNFARSKFSKTNNLEFNLCDVQTFKFNPNNFDKVISRFGVMFFENPVEAFQNIYLSMKSGGKITFVCWSSFFKNEFFTEGCNIIENYTHEKLPKITRDPGPFAFSEKDYINRILTSSGFKKIIIDEVHTFICTKDTVENDTDILLNIGPRAKLLSNSNLSEEKMFELRNKIRELCEKREDLGIISYKACLNYVSACK